jgi:HK97 family phage major capsid protein
MASRRLSSHSVRNFLQIQTFKAAQMAQYKGTEIDLVPTDSMVSEAERGLAWRQEFGRGGTEVGIARARDIKNKVDLSPDTIRRMTSFFARHEVDKQAQGFRQGEDGYPSNGRIAWALWGGDAGMAWANRKADQMDKIDQESRSYEDMRPYPNEHAARLTDPAQYNSFARKNNDFGDGIDAIYGVKAGKTELQAIRFKADKFTAAQARKWLADHDFKPIQFEEATGMKKEDAEIEKRHILNVAENDETYVITFAKEKMGEDEPADMEEDQPETLLDVAPPVELNPLEASPAMAMPLPVNSVEDRADDALQLRAYLMDASPVNKEERRVQIAVSSEMPVERSFGIEILDHNPKSIDLSFLASGRAPLLLDHDPEKQIGIIEGVNLDGSARVMRATVRFGKGSLAGEVFQDVVDGIRQNISVGYRVNKMVRDDSVDGTVYRVNSWTPLEASIVSIPADQSVGVGRSMEIISNSSEGLEMTELKQDEIRASIAKANAEILAIGAKLNKRDLAEKAIARGVSVEQFRGELIESLGSDAIVSNPNNVGLNSREAQSYSLLRAINASASNDWSKAGFEREISQEIATRLGKDARGFYVPADIGWSKRDVISGTGTGTSKGGYMIGTDQRGDLFIDALRDTLVMAGLGARMLTGLQGNVAVPKLATKTTVAFVSETNAPTEGAPVFGQLLMSPKTVAGYVDISRRMMIQSDPSVEAVLRNDIISQIAAKIDDVAIKGGGANEPTGILGTSGIGAVAIGTNGGAPTWASVVALERAVAVANAATGNLGYLTNPKVVAKLRSTARQSSGVEGNFILNDSNKLMGYDVTSTNLVPSTLTKGSSSGVCSAMIFGNFNDVIIGMWSGVDVIVDTASLSTSGSTRLAFFQDVDVGVRHAESFAAVQDYTTT